MHFSDSMEVFLKLSLKKDNKNLFSIVIQSHSRTFLPWYCIYSTVPKFLQIRVTVYFRLAQLVDDLNRQKLFFDP